MDWALLLQLPVRALRAVWDAIEALDASSKQHREDRLNNRRRLNEELAKPVLERDERLLQRLRRRDLMLHAEFYERKAAHLLDMSDEYSGYDRYSCVVRYPSSDPCCLSCNLVRQYAAASYLAQHVFHRDMGKQTREELHALDEGRPFRLVVLPTFRVKAPEAARQLDPLETCSACRKLVEKLEYDAQLSEVRARGLKSRFQQLGLLPAPSATPGAGAGQAEVPRAAGLEEQQSGPATPRLDLQEGGQQAGQDAT